jgi:VWFA-related protein
MCAAALLWRACFLAQTPLQTETKNTAEISSQDTAATFKAKVNLVTVPVVVRDRAGRAMGTLQQQDFQLFDRGKPQVISTFSVEKSGAHTAALNSAVGEQPPGGSAEKEKTVEFPDRYIAYVFDDLHLEIGDLLQVRKAAEHHLNTALQASDRAAIFTTSGQGNVDFTDDRAQLDSGLAKLMPRAFQAPHGSECPDLSYYQADLIANKNDQTALNAAAAEVMSCENVPKPQAILLAQSAARRVVDIGQHDALLTLGVLDNVVRRVVAMPGQRVVVLVSPGFLTVDPMALERVTDVLNRATRGNVIISALDARGLYTTGMDASRGSLNAYSTLMKQQYDREAALAEEDVMAELADGTGGTFFHNNNDLEAGLRRVAAAPEFYYLLGFSPQNLKMDGSFHKLKVAVKSPAVAQVQARRGYYVPKHAESEADTAKQQIEDALFSREEMHELPVELHTQFFKTNDAQAKLTILAKVDVQRIRFQKVDGRNRDELTVVSGLFDRNGNFISGQQKLLTMRFRDETLARLNSGITIRTDFDTKPGSYFVRLVVRDANQQMIAAENGAVEIP